MSTVQPGNWYFTVTCKRCSTVFAFGKAPTPHETNGPVETPNVPVSLHCGECEFEAEYLPSEILIRQVPHMD
jgi:hypothetical protein